MPETQREKITKKTLEILENNPGGIRYTDLFKQLAGVLPDVPQNTIHGTIWNLEKKEDKIVKPERGLFVLRKYAVGVIERKSDVKTGHNLPETSFYQSFADYLMQDLEECTKAIPLGGNKFGDKWGTPDVFGIYKFSETDAVRPPIEIISVEIKTDTNQLITAFGQACAYKIFSHKVYLAVPKEADTGRIESCVRVSESGSFSLIEMILRTQSGKFVHARQKASLIISTLTNIYKDWERRENLYFNSIRPSPP